MRVLLSFTELAVAAGPLSTPAVGGFGLVLGGPGGEDGQPVVGGGVGLGGPGDEVLVGVVGAGQRVSVEGELADDGVVQGFGADALVGDVVFGPPLAEVRVAH